MRPCRTWFDGTLTKRQATRRERRQATQAVAESLEDAPETCWACSWRPPSEAAAQPSHHEPGFANHPRLRSVAPRAYAGA